MRCLQLEWEAATGRDSFVVISVLAGTTALIGTDLMVPLQVQTDAVKYTAIPGSISTLHATKEPSLELRPTHTSISSTAT